jgi:hypothetical protein
MLNVTLTVNTVISLSLALTTTIAAADPAQNLVSRSAGYRPGQHKQHVVRHHIRYRESLYRGPTYSPQGYGAPIYIAPGYGIATRYPDAYITYRGPGYLPGYVFVPGTGYVDKACNLPSSGCWNEERDVNY